NTAWTSAQGTAKLIQIIRQAPIEPGMVIPEIMVVAPPRIIEPKGIIADKFRGAATRCRGLSTELEKVANEYDALFLNSTTITEASTIDGIHLDEDQHDMLGKAIARMLSESNIF
ncbi:MAG: hypothetical protein P8X57_09980, partial [Cyclobacteriaceae bacterium]